MLYDRAIFDLLIFEFIMNISTIEETSEHILRSGDFSSFENGGESWLEMLAYLKFMNDLGRI